MKPQRPSRGFGLRNSLDVNTLAIDTLALDMVTLPSIRPETYRENVALSALFFL
jgi:hypothetical protein